MLLLRRQRAAPYHYKGEVSSLLLSTFPLPVTQSGPLPQPSSGADQTLPSASESLVWQKFGQLLISKSTAYPEP